MWPLEHDSYYGIAVSGSALETTQQDFSDTIKTSAAAAWTAARSCRVVLITILCAHVGSMCSLCVCVC